MDSDECITAVMIGAGNRGKDVYGQYALDHPHELKFIAVAEPHSVRRNQFARAHFIPSSGQYETWEDLLQSKIAEAAFICTQDRKHTAPALKALNLGYNVLLEKPMATKIDECILLTKKAEEVKKQLRIAHVLRYTPFFQKIYEIIQSGQIGDVITIDHRENVSYWHMAHSFVRGHWAKEKSSSPMILAKSCHDLDILYWLVGSSPRIISSFGSLTHFKPDNAPSGATKRCLDGCNSIDSCKYYAPRIYIDIIPLLRIAQIGGSRKVHFIANLALKHPRIFSKLKGLPLFRQVDAYQGWPVSTITEDLSIEGKWNALRNSPYGSCVYFADSDVVDHQVTIIEFENSVTATFTMHGHSHLEGRTIRIDGTKGTLIGEFLASGERIIFYNHLKETEDIIFNKKMQSRSGHGGGDLGLVESFIKSLHEETKEPLTSASASLESHIMAFAAEEARLTDNTIKMDEFKNRF
ncbi:MAG: Gfo/Idh/MocA family oxidoreductase [Candidatus Heimdallarchaeota archaeon]|nr:MAG: Gfo/Idh/MocA family oxidoreductase [Candidatus Heimdallarchaeota archaeon]